MPRVWSGQFFEYYIGPQPELWVRHCLTCAFSFCIKTSRVICASCAGVARSGNETRAITDAVNTRPEVVSTERYVFSPAGEPDRGFRLARSFSERAHRGETVAQKMLEMRQDGFTPDLVVGHFGWGETLFVKAVCPNEAHPLRRVLLCGGWWRRRFRPRISGAVNGFGALDGGAGNDTLSGLSGQNVYILRRGYGVDLAVNGRSSIFFDTYSKDTVEFNASVLLSDVSVHRVERFDGSAWRLPRSIQWPEPPDRLVADFVNLNGAGL